MKTSCTVLIENLGQLVCSRGHGFHEKAFDLGDNLAAVGIVPSYMENITGSGTKGRRRLAGADGTETPSICGKSQWCFLRRSDGDYPLNVFWEDFFNL